MHLRPSEALLELLEGLLRGLELLEGVAGCDTGSELDAAYNTAQRLGCSPVFGLPVRCTCPPKVRVRFSICRNDWNRLNISRSTKGPEDIGKKTVLVLGYCYTRNSFS